MNKKARKILIISLCVIAAIAAVYFTAVGIYKGNLERRYPSDVVNYKGRTVAERFIVPEGYERVEYPVSSISPDYQHLKLKKFGLGAYTEDGARIFDAPLWGVAKFDKDVPGELDEYGWNSQIFRGKRYVQKKQLVDPENVYPGCLCLLYNEATEEGIFSGIVLDICKNESGDTKIIAGVLKYGNELYVAGNPDGSLTPWVDVDKVDFSFGSGAEEGFRSVFWGLVR